MINNEWFNLGIQRLTQSDRDLATIITQYGTPLQWKREPSFATLMRIILEQQVSLVAAKATFERLCAVVTTLTPENFLKLDDLQLKSVGFSHQKTKYGRELAQAILREQLDLNSLENLDDLAIRNKLKQIKGIGDWTVDMYLIMALQRPDIFPNKDLAVAIATQEIKQLATRPQPDELELIAEAWRPYRAIATMILWHYYLNRK